VSSLCICWYVFSDIAVKLTFQVKRNSGMYYWNYLLNSVRFLRGAFWAFLR